MSIVKVVFLIAVGVRCNSMTECGPARALTSKDTPSIRICVQSMLMAAMKEGKARRLASRDVDGAMSMVRCWGVGRWVIELEVVPSSVL